MDLLFEIFRNERSEEIIPLTDEEDDFDFEEEHINATRYSIQFETLSREIRVRSGSVNGGAFEGRTNDGGLHDRYGNVITEGDRSVSGRRFGDEYYIYFGTYDIDEDVNNVEPDAILNLIY
jgi:hypothetical protein